MTTTAPIERMLYTPPEAAELLAISIAKLYDMLAHGVLESVKIGHSRRIPRQALEAYVESLRP